MFVTAVAVAGGTTDAAAIAAETNANAGQKLVGFCVTENAAAAARVTLHHGDANSDPRLFDIWLAASETVIQMFPEPIPIPEGLFYERVSGNTTLTFFYSRR